jgi:hypothetical protein
MLERPRDLQIPQGVRPPLDLTLKSVKAPFGSAVRQDIGAVGHRDRVLKVGGGLAVFGDDRPLVFQQDHLALAHHHHGLDRYRHARLELKVAAALLGVTKFGDLRLFVHAPADAVADELADHAEAVPLHVPLHQPGDIRPLPVRLDVLDRQKSVSLVTSSSFCTFGVICRPTVVAVSAQ